MKPLVVLLVSFAASLLLIGLLTGEFDIILAGNIALCIMMCFTALGHFLFPRGMALMIPPFVPGRIAWVYITGVLEVLLGLALLLPSWRLYAGMALIAFFILLLPANIYAAIKHLNYEKGTYDGPGLSYLWFRVPFQLLLIGWAVFFSIFPSIPTDYHRRDGVGVVPPHRVVVGTTGPHTAV